MRRSTSHSPREEGSGELKEKKEGPPDPVVKPEVDELDDVHVLLLQSVLSLEVK
ncbi:hypothetical protein N9L68_05955 [bacterium]|nr:hypothetical protein [bacterium]